MHYPQDPAVPPRPVRRTRRRFYAVAAVSTTVVAGALFTVALHVRAENVPTPVRIVNQFERDSGRHPGFRRNHAKGVCVSGHFDSDGQGAGLSHASVFGRGSVPVIGRFSAPGGNPQQEDVDTTVRSFALLFRLKNGEQWRTAMNSAPVFMVATPQAVLEQLDASRPDPRTGRADPARLDAFQQRHPETRALLDWERGHPPSSGFDNAAYYSIDSFRLTDTAGATHAVRWRVEPQRAYQPVSDAPTDDPDFLAHELAHDVAQGPVRWHLVLTEARPGDPLDDATRAWPDDGLHREIDAGTLVIDRVQAQVDGPCRDVNFDPLVLPAGIAASNDPLLAARSTVYAESFRRRIGEEAQARQGDSSHGWTAWIATVKAWIEPSDLSGASREPRTD
ncbi:catalase family peroxidase [Paraburkholderia flava]|uniref:catalase family peroxidase n=1 Tax=Paraburkholderia flava TaxID=2547393 RepID=UPI00106008B8